MRKFALLLIVVISSVFTYAQDESEERFNFLLKRIGKTNHFQLCYLNDLELDAYYSVVLEFDVPSVKENEKVDFQVVLPADNAMSGFMNFFSYDSSALGKKVEVGFGVMYFANIHGTWQFNTQCFDRVKVDSGFKLHAFSGPAVQLEYARVEKKYFVLSWDWHFEDKHVFTVYDNRDYALSENNIPILFHRLRDPSDLINYNSASGNFELQKRNAAREIENSHSNLFLVSDRLQKEMAEEGWSGFVTTPGKADGEASFNLMAPPTEDVIQQIYILLPSFAYNEERLLFSIYPTHSDFFQPIMYQSELVESKDGINVYSLTIGYNVEVQYVEPRPNLVLPTNYIIIQAAKYYNGRNKLDNITSGWEKTDTYKFVYQSGDVKRNKALTRYVMHEEGKIESLSLADREYQSRYNCVSYGYKFIEDYTMEELKTSGVYLTSAWDKYVLITVVSECDSIPLRMLLPNGGYFTPKWSRIDENDPTVRGALISADFYELKLLMTSNGVCDDMYVDIYTCGEDEDREKVSDIPRETFETVMKDLFWFCNGNANCLRGELVSVKSDHKIYACKKPCMEALVYYKESNDDELVFSFFPKEELDARVELSQVVQAVLALSPSDGKFIEASDNSENDWSFVYSETNTSFNQMRIDVSFNSILQLDSSDLTSAYFVKVIVREQR